MFPVREHLPIPKWELSKRVTDVKALQLLRVDGIGFIRQSVGAAGSPKRIAALHILHCPYYKLAYIMYALNKVT